jgi:hypothetical protein
MGHRSLGAAADREAVRARLNLYAVLPNLADVVRFDPEMAALVSDRHVSIGFRVANGLGANVRLAGGECTVERTACRCTDHAGAAGPAAGGLAQGLAEGPAAGGSPEGAATAAEEGADAVATSAGGATKGPAGADVVLWFASPAHLNKMFDGTAQPVPLKGFTKLGFLKKEFTQLTDRMAYYLKPTDELLADPAYLAMNTRLTLNTAALAVPILLAHDPVARHLRGAFRDGSVAIDVLPEGPNVGLVFGPSSIRPVQGRLEAPTALIRMRDLQTANDFLNGRMDTFAAVALGQVQIWGCLPKVDTLSLVLDRIPEYLS